MIHQFPIKRALMWGHAFANWAFFTDGMTADFYPFDMKFLGETATHIINEVKGVNRVVYDVTSKPPGTIEWE